MPSDIDQIYLLFPRGLRAGARRVQGNIYNLGNSREGMEEQYKNYGEANGAGRQFFLLKITDLSSGYQAVYWLYCDAFVND